MTATTSVNYPTARYPRSDADSVETMAYREFLTWDPKQVALAVRLAQGYEMNGKRANAARLAQKFSERVARDKEVATIVRGLKPKGTWKPGDVAHYVAGSTRPVTAGLYFYSGFGTGTYYGADFKTYSVCNSEAYALAESQGVKYEMHDSFDGYVPTALGDR